MILATIHAMGLTDEQLPGRILAVSQADFLCVTETWAGVHTSWGNEQKVLQVMAPTTSGRFRRGGGVALLGSPHCRLKYISKRSTAESQVLVASLNGVTIIGDYLAPGRPQHVLKPTLEWIGQYLRGEVVLLGDFNARKRRWDHANNPYGSALLRWTATHRLHISAPPSPTFERHGGCFTVDLFISRSSRLGDI